LESTESRWTTVLSANAPAAPLKLPSTSTPSRLPATGFLTFNEEPEQYLFAYVLRPGNVGASVGALGILSRLLPKLRAAFPRARPRVRLDGGFAAAKVFEFLEREGLEYVVAMAKNKVLERRAARLMGTARRRSRESGETEHLYKDCRYAAGTWDQHRRVVIKAPLSRRSPKRAAWPASSSD
jgi:hypothetical protein